MTLTSLARQWINETFNNEILILNHKTIETGAEKGTVIVRSTVTANDCLLIASGRQFDLKFTLYFNNNRLAHYSVDSDDLTVHELEEFRPRN